VHAREPFEREAFGRSRRHIALLAEHRFGVRWTVAGVNDPAHAGCFTPAAGVDVVVSAAELIARMVQEEVTAGDSVVALCEPGRGT
jgi:hypothetical protein